MPKRLSKRVKISLQKAIDSALLAVETYNKPAVKFKSGGYIVLMCIAWTSLFHAIFLKNGRNPYYKDKVTGKIKRVDGEIQFWELKNCVQEYFGDDSGGVRKNIEFFIPLRNKLEHKFLPSLDANIFAECQSFLLNFDRILEKEFGAKYCIHESLSFALQLFPSVSKLKVVFEDKRDSKEIVNFINNYRSSITTDILDSGEYSFKAFLVQVANHNSKDAMPIQFISYDKLNEEQKKNVSRVAALIKERYVPVANKGTLKPGVVVSLVQKRLGNQKVIRGMKKIDKFTQDTHTRCWKKYSVRPEKNSKNPEKTNSKYCIYDEPNKNYLFTEAWVDFLVEKMSDENEYQSLYKKETLD